MQEIDLTYLKSIFLLLYCFIFRTLLIQYLIRKYKLEADEEFENNYPSKWKCKICGYNSKNPKELSSHIVQCKLDNNSINSDVYIYIYNT